MFDPSVGQWLEEDPIQFNAGDANLRRYASNTPMDDTDLAGLETEKEHDTRFENKTGVYDAINGGAGKPARSMFPITGYTGQRKVESKRFADGTQPTNVIFDVEKAFQGTRIDQKNREFKGIYIKIRISADMPRNASGDIRCLQVVRFFKDLKKDGTSTTRKPEGYDYAERTGIDDPRATHPGWMMEKNPLVPYKAGDPFWLDSSFFDGSQSGKSGPGGTAAVVRDAPGYSGKQEYLKKTVFPTDVGMEAYTAAYVVTPAGSVYFLGALRWGYNITASGEIEPLTQQVKTTEPPEIQAAADRLRKLVK